MKLSRLNTFLLCACLLVFCVAASVSSNRFTPVWNNASNTFTALEIDATDTASTGTNILLDLQISDSSKFSVDESGNTTVAGTLGVTGATTATSIAATSTITGVGIQDHSNEAITATAGGGTTGLITQGTTFVTVTCDTATKQISLPAATIGDEIWIQCDTTGCELISAVAAHTVNNVVVGATNALALTASSLYHCKYVAANTWIVRGFTNLGADEAALVPDAL